MRKNMLVLSMMPSNLLTAAIFTIRLAFCFADELSYMPSSSRIFPDDTYTIASLNSSYVRINPNGSSSTVDKLDDGRFAESHVAESSGLLVHVVSNSSDEPNTGCSLPWRASYGKIPKNEKWIALVKKGGKCNSQTKMQNAFNSNASGIIIYNDKPSSMLEKMRQQGNVPKNFSVVFTYKWKGEELYEMVDNGTAVYMRISIGEVTTKPIATVNKTSVLFVSISFLILMMVSLGWIIFYYVQKCRYLHAKDRLSKRLSNAAKKALQKIPTRHIKADDKEICSNGNSVLNDSCAICIELFKPADVVRLLPCRHEFHKLCIDPWLLEHRTCPMCKMDILKYFGFELTGSQESMLRIEQEDPFHDIFFFSPDVQNASQIVEASSIIPVTINHQSRNNMESRPSTSRDEVTSSLTANSLLESRGHHDKSLIMFRNPNNKRQLRAGVGYHPNENGAFNYSPCYPSPFSGPGDIPSDGHKAAAGNLRRSVSLSNVEYPNGTGQL